MRAGKREEPGASIAPAMEGAPQAEEGAKDYQYKEDEELQGGEKPRIRVKRAPEEPTAAEREDHAALHEPYRAWCRACVAGRGRADRHVTRGGEEKALPIVGVDYGYLNSRGDEDEEFCSPMELGETLRQRHYTYELPWR